MAELTPEQISKLPKYAQEALQQKDYQIADLRHRLAHFEGEQQPSPFRVPIGSGRDKTMFFISPDHGIEVVLGEDENGTENVIGLYVETHPVVGKRLRVMGEGHPTTLHVVPQASNVLSITTQRY